MSAEEPDHHVDHMWPAYLDYFREQISTAVLSLPESERRTSHLPSGWTPIELLSHCLHMEQRWFVWGFLGEQVTDVWGDWTADNPWDPAVEARWRVDVSVSADELAERLRELGRRTTDILASHPLDAVAAEGDRFEGDPATLEWICFHVLQEYARHAGHLDIAVEIAGGPTGK